MRLLALTLALTACGTEAPPEPAPEPPAAGNWRVTIEDHVSCTMGLSGPNEAVTGSLACTGGSSTVTGHVTLDSVSLTFASPGFDPFLLTGTLALSGTHISGALHGSGYTGQPFVADKLP